MQINFKTGNEIIVGEGEGRLIITENTTGEFVITSTTKVLGIARGSDKSVVLAPVLDPTGNEPPGPPSPPDARLAHSKVG